MYNPPRTPLNLFRSLLTGFHRLSNELVLEIATYLDTPELYALMRVNKRFAILLDHVLSDILLNGYEHPTGPHTTFAFATRFPHSLILGLHRRGVDLNKIFCICGFLPSACICSLPLHQAIRYHNVTMVDALLRSGADPTRTYYSDGNNAVHLSIYTTGRHAGYDGIPQPDDMAILKLLLAGGRLQTMNDAASLNYDGLSWLSIAVGFSPPKDLTIVSLFLGSGLDLNVAAKRKLQTPLHIAVRAYKVPVMELLLQHGADFRTTDAEGMTPFASACAICSCRMMHLLLLRDANLVGSVVNEMGETAEACLQRETVVYALGEENPFSGFVAEMVRRHEMLARLRHLAKLRRADSVTDDTFRSTYLLLYSNFV